MTILCSADKATRTITFHVRDDFGDGKNDAGLFLANYNAVTVSEVETEEAHRIFQEALDVITGKRFSAVPVERWVRIRLAEAAQ